MTKRQIRREGYDLIVNLGMSHQEAFDILRERTKIGLNSLARQLSQIPSRKKMDRTRVLRFVLIFLLLFVITVWSLDLVHSLISVPFKFTSVYIRIFLGIVIPGTGIYAALYGRLEFYNVVGFFLLISLFKLIRIHGIELDLETTSVYGAFTLAAFLSFYLYFAQKTTFRKWTSFKIADGVQKEITQYQFENTRMKREDVLDDGI